jgi:hypothetical protein
MNREVHVRIRGGREVKVLPATRPPDVITLAVRWYLRYGLSYREVEELWPSVASPSITSASFAGCRTSVAATTNSTLTKQPPCRWRPVALGNAMQCPDLRSSCGAWAWMIVGCYCCRSCTGSCAVNLA